MVGIRRAVLDTDDSTLTLGGQLNLADETLALRSDITAKDFSPFSLRAPLLVSGTLAALLPFLAFGQMPSRADAPCAVPR